MNNIPIFKIRASAIGDIMSNPKGKSVAEKIKDLEVKLDAVKLKLLGIREGLKSHAQTRERIEKIQAQIDALVPFKDTPNLSQTCTTFLHKWVNQFLYDRRLEFTSKMTDKGNLVEGDAIIYASGHIAEMGLSSKNQITFTEHPFIEGTPDVLTSDYVFDAKSSYTHDTFPLHYRELPEDNYDWQVKGYMELSKRRKGRVLYILMSMPEEMIEREAKWKLPIGFSREEYETFAEQFRYDHLPPFLRLKEFEVEWDEEAINAIERRVMECRDYIENSILPTLMENVAKYGDDE